MSFVQNRGKRGLGKYTIGRPWREAWAAAELARQERAAALAKARQKRRPKCQCAAYPWPHRPGGGLCRHPNPPLETWKGKAGTHRPLGERYRGMARTICREYGLNPIRDRERIARIMPRLFPAWLKSHWPAYYDALKWNGRIDAKGRLKVTSIIAR